MVLRIPQQRLFLLIVLLFSLSPPSAQGQLPSLGPRTSIEASVRASQAREALRRGDVDEALRLFREAVSLGAPPLVFRELAQTLERQALRREAAEVWTRYATLARTVEERDDAIRRRENLRRLPSLLRVRVLPHRAARTAMVWFDHEPPRPLPAGGAESMVEGGPHRVRVEAAGWIPYETTVQTGYGEPAEVLVRMNEATDAGAAPRPASR